MPIARKRQISLADTPYYHCVSRCVRRAFLCGEDKLSGKSFDHRRQWVEDRLLLLADIFSIDVCAYAIMHNHTHVVLRVDLEKATNWTDEEVAIRWLKLHKGTLLCQRAIWETSLQLTEIEQRSLASTINIYRKRLFDISWFMKELNEPIARRANLEDECTGHFWEGRFKSQALLDERALTACMVYVDLNPIRAKIANTLETSDHTSIKQRISSLNYNEQPKSLLPFRNTSNSSQSHVPNIELLDYIELAKMTARYISQKQGDKFQVYENSILREWGVDKDAWLSLSCQFEINVYVAGGHKKALSKFKINTERQRIWQPKFNFG
ncbi:transposase [Aliiglaciecola sp. LCG003]|uniref:transposase n=1 Tax=Aliiglaciecola sp. LCG003 TaxID=3053655 RepID=UPI0025722FBE|nr:transposase [Aliiglaciecola sp. LCG003]WJG11240.1 transposase [Aliiglaciecola sp. LCG003]